MAVHKRRGNAYGVTIREEVSAQSRREPSFGAIYTTLQRLEDDGLLTSREGDPTPERGGRAKRLYELTAPGLRALQEASAGLQSQLEGFAVAGGRAG
ncbi:PadR family transcriptional regulator [Geminicoccus harenae]|nr:helix-turn-helix transcriptional regulator [Geminicoccus harenae]